MNTAYIGKLMELAEKDKELVHLLADSGTGLDALFQRNFPERCFNFGIGEENMLAAAAGMATIGKIPFVFTAGAFLAYRSMEFIRDDICFQNLNVKIVGMGSGLSWSALGPTHHTTEDFSVLRALPNLMILSPSTPLQVTACVELAYKHRGPVYIRIEMNHEREFFQEENKDDLTENQILLDGDYFKREVRRKAEEKGATIVSGKGQNKILIYTSGSILQEAYNASLRLMEDGVYVKLIAVTKIKPFPEEEVLREMESFENIVVVEEHNIHGGLAGIIAECMAYHGIRGRMLPIGLQDCFAEGYGTIDKVRCRNGLDATHIYQELRRLV